MKKYMLVLLLMSSCATTAAREQKHLDLSIDVAQFLGSDGQSYLEIYFSLPERGPLYVQANGGFVCDVMMSVEIFQDDSLWANKVWRISNTLADTAATSASRQLVDMLRYPVTPGRHYQITLFARDARRSSLDSVRVDWTSANWSRDLALSDLQLANSIASYDSSCNEVFRKRFYCVTPNPEFTFGGEKGDLYYYFEAYNLQKNLHALKYRVLTRILDGQGELLAQVPPVIHERDLKQDVIREIGQFPMRDIPSGTYQLEYALTDSANGVLLRKSKLFLVQNPGLKPLAPVFAQGDQEMHFLDDFDLKKLDEEFDKLFALTSKGDRDIYRSLKEADAKRAFLYKFWASLTPPDYSLTQDFRIRYMKDCEYVANYFSRPGKSGWRSDRGIVFLRYGKPSDIERHTVGKDTKPYEIWHYENIENGVIFVFVDRMGFNQYELIHSTMRGEVYNPQWERLVQPAATDDITM
ncbi:MAG TPA: GWxTD domain-containing protein [bacterium]|nr:GWxTD domain-containing protein [bacterium]HQG45480.1 GWxTD domain-containing protein [bacterium]HQI49202.1 GWxTD domain-containing protein [bacterium]HQJ64295.1 GWxTD domain-containing protein [bacterium]